MIAIQLSKIAHDYSPAFQSPQQQPEPSQGFFLPHTRSPSLNASILPSLRVPGGSHPGNKKAVAVSRTACSSGLSSVNQPSGGFLGSSWTLRHAAIAYRPVPTKVHGEVVPSGLRTANDDVCLWTFI